ncbi:MAG: serine hydrolase [Planctomycetota bacterium]
MLSQTKLVVALVVLCVLFPVRYAGAQDATDQPFDYFAANREMVRNGVQAVLMCNGLFTSGRTLEQVYAQELAYLADPIGTAAGGSYSIDWDRRAVEIGGGDDGPVMRAAFREGIGAVILSPDQTLDDLDELPTWPPPCADEDRRAVAWPYGDLVEPSPTPVSVDIDALAAASEWAFDRASDEQVTVSLLIVHKDQIIHERYAPGFDVGTRTRTWSTAKSIAATLIGILVDDGRLSLDDPVGIEWLPSLPAQETDPRRAITLRDLLQMASGLDPVDSFGMEYATGSGLAYWAGASSTQGARRRALVREPGAVWEYENYDTLLAVLEMKRVLGSAAAYQRFPREALLERIGMCSTLLSTDRFGDFILSSQVYTNARDLARFGMLYLNGGVWDGQRIISEDWIEFVRTPAPSTEDRGNFYGGQWWLVPDGRTDVPADAYSTAGNRGQYVIVVPSHDLVIVRRGLDYGRQGFNRWDLTREVLKAVKAD